MPWYGYLLCSLFIYLVGFVSGRATGRAEVLQQSLAMNQVGKMGDLSAILRNQGVTPPGER
jgi:hypothetical protein